MVQAKSSTRFQIDRLTVRLRFDHDAKFVMEFLIVESKSKLLIINPRNLDVSNRKYSFQFVLEFDLELLGINFNTGQENIFKFETEGFIIFNIVFHDDANAVIQSFELFNERKFDEKFDAFWGMELRNIYKYVTIINTYRNDDNISSAFL